MAYSRLSRFFSILTRIMNIYTRSTPQNLFRFHKAEGVLNTLGCGGLLSHLLAR
jgi:hypothetical protein